VRDQLPRTKVPLEQEDRDEDRGDDQYFLSSAALDPGPHDEEREHDKKHGTRGHHEHAAPVQAHPFGPPFEMIRRLAQAKGS